MKASDINKVRKAAHALADASDILEGDLWNKAVTLMGKLNAWVNQHKREKGGAR